MIIDHGSFRAFQQLVSTVTGFKVKESRYHRHFHFVTHFHLHCSHIGPVVPIWGLWSPWGPKLVFWSPFGPHLFSKSPFSPFQT